MECTSSLAGRPRVRSCAPPSEPLPADGKERRDLAAIGVEAELPLKHDILQRARRQVASMRQASRTGPTDRDRLTSRALRTPRAAAMAGIPCALLLTAALGLVRLAAPSRADLAVRAGAAAYAYTIFEAQGGRT